MKISTRTHITKYLTILYCITISGVPQPPTTWQWCPLIILDVICWYGWRSALRSAAMVNYARYLPVYYADLSNISTQYPDIYNNFLDGRFSVQLGSDNPFGKIPVDQTTEQTVNKDTKTSGDVRKYSLNANAVSRFYLTAEYRSAYLHQFRKMVGMIKSGLHHAELQKPRILKDEAAVTSVVETLDNCNIFWRCPRHCQSVDFHCCNSRHIWGTVIPKFREDRIGEGDAHSPLPWSHKHLSWKPFLTWPRKQSTQQWIERKQFSWLTRNSLPRHERSSAWMRCYVIH